MELSEIRKEIDTTDEQITSLFVKRMQLVASVAEYKSRVGMNVFDAQREQELIKRVSDLAGAEFEDYVRTLYGTILELSRSYQHKKIDDAHRSNMHCGLIGKKLSHSFSPMIHSELADYSYELIELDENELEPFVAARSLDAYNVTIPYKKAIIPLLDEISPEARSIGAVNTVVNMGGKLCGYNTDYFGFCHMLDVSEISIKGKKALVFGNGGASATVCAVLGDRGASSIEVIGRQDNTSAVLSKHSDAQIIVNTSPVGMYPNNGESPVDLSLFPTCEGVLDVIYNPQKTALILDAESRGIKCVSGLSMLVAQAVKASELFTSITVDQSECERITRKIRLKAQNIALIGMPGCGKTRVGKLLANALERSFFDADEEFQKKFGVTPAEVISAEGEDKFRLMEHEVTKELGKLSGAVIAYGGGVVTRECNYAPIRQNSTVIFLERDLDKLSKKGRPLSQSTSVEQLYNARIDAYVRFSDIRVKSTEIPEKTCAIMIERIGEQR